MREIKYRVWDGEIMHYPDSNFSYELSYTRAGAWQLWWNKETCIASQFDDGVHFLEYIGLKDKNGNEIYEGDIVKWEGLGTIPRKVIWDNYKWNVQQFWCSSYDCPGDAFSEEMVFTVIGNIHEKPELL